MLYCRQTKVYSKDLVQIQLVCIMEKGQKAQEMQSFLFVIVLVLCVDL